MNNRTSVEDRAKVAAGAWRTWDSFSWWGRDRDIVTDDAEWALVMVATRDSGLLDQSNAAYIGKVLDPFTQTDPPTAMPQEFSNWLVGWTVNWAIRVYENGEITPAWRAWCDLEDRIDNYPILDENDYSEREAVATDENIKQTGKLFAARKDVTLLPGWEGALSEWLFANVSDAGASDGDDQGWWPGDDDLENAFYALRWLTDDEETEPAERIPTRAELISAGQIELGL